ncbi:glycogen debranching protein GlgX [Anaerobiospirillum succiniciproducens]|uniref:glycogen debranching protein GlgX n=1 Tax=Anaerobiospirillum succiniciproducens TaxID=13335 RepID=UPI0029420284|nr:glycogen debranching protein GlgX [Anaerobiospirillum succiniciproducens]
MLEFVSEDRMRQTGLGATLYDDGCYFSIWAPDAAEVVVHLYSKKEVKLGSFPLGQQKGGVWYGFIKGAKAGDCYALETRGTNDPNQGFYFKEGRYLVDPYAKLLTKPFNYDEDMYLNHSEEFIPKAVIVGNDDFNWEGVKKVFRDRADVILYEAHVRGMTKLKEEVPLNHRGTYLGMCHESVIEHLKRLGITTVQLMPVAASMSEPFLVKRGLKNYWGYNPVCFMAPNPDYACDPLNAINEFKTMVKTFHKNGIAVILDVVFNHTAEAGIDGPVLSYKGLDARSYYAYEPKQDRSLDYANYINATGCGNSFNADSMVSTRLIIDSLKYWLKEMRVDGFRFDLAVTICRESHAGSYYAFDSNCGFFKACFANEEIQHALMVAEPWDPGLGGYHLGGFPRGWSEQNDRYRDAVRKFWRGDRGLLGELATRILGSRDVFAKGQRSINASVNYITYHDGFTLEDLVSYNFKHNELNQDNNSDGTNENYSYNCGEEGVSRDPEVIKRRWQMKRNLMATLIISQGIPHFLGGDELSRTQLGNNNSYCQDNDLNYYHWNISQEQRYFLDYLCKLMRVLNTSRVLKEINLFDDFFYKFENDYIAKWRKSNGTLLSDADWHSTEINHFCLYVGDRNNKGERWCLIVNNEDKDLMFRLPSIFHDRYWSAVIDSSEVDGEPRRYSNESGLENMVAAHSVKIMRMETVQTSKLLTEEALDELADSSMLQKYTRGNTRFQY